MSASEICGILDKDLVNFIHNIVVLLKIAVPIILVILGMLDFGKGVASSKEDEIKKGQNIFIKRLIAAACVFFVVTIVQLVMGLVSKEDGSFWSCANGILNGTAGMEYNVDDGVPGGNTNSGETNNGSTSATDNGTNNETDNKKNFGTINASNSSSTGIRCSNDLEYTEYNACVNTWHLDEAVCHSIFQSACSSTNSNVLWTKRVFLGNDDTINDALLGALKKSLSVSSCGTFSGEIGIAGVTASNEYLLELASCVDSYGSLEEALNKCKNDYFKGLCR